MMQGAEYWLRNDAALVYWLNFSKRWRVAVERLLWVRAIVVLEVLRQDPNQICVIQHDNVIGALATNRADQACYVLMLIGEGLSGPQIGRHVCRRPKTIEWPRRSLGKNLGATNRMELARVAAHSGLRHIRGIFPRLRMRLTKEERDPSP